MDKNHPRARHSWIQIEVQIGPSVIKQWAFPCGHVGTAAVRLCGWSPLQRCEMEIRLEVKPHSKLVSRKAVNTATPSPSTPFAAKHTYYTQTFSGVNTPPDSRGKEEWSESQWSSQPNPVYLKDGWWCWRGLCLLTVDAAHSLWSLVVTECVPVANSPKQPLYQNTKRCVKIGKNVLPFSDVLLVHQVRWSTF